MSMSSSPTSVLTSQDQDWVALARKGNATAFRHLVNQYLPMVYNALYRMTQNHELSEEIAQEAFVKAYQHLNRFDANRGSFKAWLLKIAHNAAVSELRKRTGTVSLNALEETGSWGEMDHQTTEDPLQQVERELSTEALTAAIEKLDPKYRDALLLRFQQDLSYEEISQALNIPLNTTRTWIKRGLEKLRTEVLKAELSESTGSENA